MNPDKQLFLLRYGKDTTVTYPDYSFPENRDEFFTWLCRERPEMWRKFDDWAFDRWDDLQTGQSYIGWLFFSSPSRPRDLLAEWLRLDETIKRFGWVKCPNCDVFNTGFCNTCGGSGKVLSPWAKYAKEGE